MENNAQYIQGNIGKTIIRSAIPMLAGTLAISGYNVVDTYFVAQLGQSPLAAIGFTFPVIMFINCIYHGFSNGTLTSVAHALGEKNHSRARNTASAGLLLQLLVAFMLSIIGYLSIDFIFSMCGATQETLPLIHDYMNTWFLGSFSIALAMCGNGLLLATGDTKSASTMMMTGMGINAILDPILIFGYWKCPALGIKGAAIATVLSQTISFIGMYVILNFKHRLLSLHALRKRYLRICWFIILRIAIPSALGMIIVPIGAFIRTRMIASFGEVAVAAVAAESRIEVVAFILPMAIGMPLMSMVAQNYGAKLYQRLVDCHTFTMSFAFFYELLMAVVYWISAPYVATFFSSDPEVIKIIIISLRIIPFGFGLVEVHRYSGFFYTGCNHPNHAACLSIFRIVLLVLFSYFATLANWLTGLFVAHLCTDVISGTTGFLLTRNLVKKLANFSNNL